MLGYYNDKKSTDEVIKNGWFYTGDLGYMDNDNFLYITGRKKNIIILSNGENISPEEIESVLGNDKGVCEVIVFSKNNKLVASIYPNEEYIGDQEYFDNLVYQYNKKMPKNRQIALVLLGIIAITYKFIFHVFQESGLLRDLTTIGFLINTLITVGLFVIAFAKKFNQFIIKKLVSLLYK